MIDMATFPATRENLRQDIAEYRLTLGALTEQTQVEVDRQRRGRGVLAVLQQVGCEGTACGGFAHTDLTEQRTVGWRTGVIDPLAQILNGIRARSFRFGFCVFFELVQTADKAPRANEAGGVLVVGNRSAQMGLQRACTPGRSTVLFGRHRLRDRGTLFCDNREEPRKKRVRKVAPCFVGTALLEATPLRIKENLMRFKPFEPDAAIQWKPMQGHRNCVLSRTRVVAVTRDKMR